MEGTKTEGDRKKAEMRPSKQKVREELLHNLIRTSKLGNFGIQTSFKNCFFLLGLTFFLFLFLKNAFRV